MEKRSLRLSVSLQPTVTVRNAFDLSPGEGTLCNSSITQSIKFDLIQVLVKTEEVMLRFLELAMPAVF